MPLNYYQLVPCKIKKAHAINKNSLIKSHIPKTKKLTYCNLKNMLNNYSMVVFKPINGRGGKKIGFIFNTNQENLYTVHYVTKDYFNMSIRDILKFIKRIALYRKFIIQEGINLIKYDNKPVDIRVMLQKPYKKWKITGILARVAAENKMVTNLCGGGSGMLYYDFMNSTKFNKEDIIKLERRMYYLATSVAHTLSRKYPGLRELGFDFGIDNNMKLWLFEVNTKPNYEKFEFLKDKSMYKKINRNHNIILNSIKYCSHTTNSIKYRVVVS